MVDKEEIRKTPSPLNINEAIEGDTLNQKTARILKNDLLLYEAVIKNEADTVRKVLKETVDVDSRNNYGRAPIHWAASRGNTEIIEMLIQAKCDIEARDKFGMRPLHMAARYGHRDAVKMLINAGANVSAVNKKQYTLLMCAARGNNVRVVEYLAEAVESLNGDATDCTGATALHHAASAGHPSMITALSNVPRIELNATDKKGQTPIHCACAEEHLEAVEVLIGLGANVDAQDYEGNTPLHVATRTRHTAIVQLLLRAGANTELIDEIGFTPLHVAASQGCKGILESMIQHGAALNKQCKYGNTPLHLACQNNEVETVEILINKGVDLNCLNSRLQSPFHIATEIGHNDICKLLLAAGANIEQRDQSGKTPLYIAARGSFTAIVDMIIKTARLDYPTPEDSTSDKEIRDLTPARRRWREGSRGESISSNGSVLSEHIRSILWKLAYKQLGPEDWKKLALHWAFTNDQIRAIEHQYTAPLIGPSSYKEHGFRMLMIWASGLNPEISVGRELCDALSAVDKKSVAESVRKHMDQEKDGKTKLNKQRCHKCSIT
ncbi:ankyrin repeat and death domain-containing protein 1A isoform X1 [Apis mellifera]|uniref:Ankyrin repeat and death domain-containing protein 1A isoform X1 n=1 Tax=Apis mellifera TaxID=7460 RepID=A0A7M7GM32_APIME|nr:ankyrin repeat and death domain-containing protein 1A isoform X1 [Apis mellifera]XP_006560482.1 ankyrin repeat and death domain-containing protein 1A isoform X1 [Apis mellifera]|eukprot:XP_006560481.1 ankyrin repeat and death domain-containing protein 1A isoform X1 [Apis mellifera]